MSQTGLYRMHASEVHRLKRELADTEKLFEFIKEREYRAKLAARAKWESVPSFVLEVLDEEAYASLWATIEQYACSWGNLWHKCFDRIQMLEREIDYEQSQADNYLDW